MAMHPDMERALANTPASPGPIDRAYLDAIEAYRQNPGPKVVDLLPVPGISPYASRLGATAGHLFPSDGGLPAVGDLAAYAWARGHLDSPLAEGFFFASLKRGLENADLMAALIDFTRRMEVADKNLASFAVRHFGHSLSFGWTQDEVKRGSRSLHARRNFADLNSNIRTWKAPVEAPLTQPLERLILELDADSLSPLLFLKSAGFLGRPEPVPDLIATVAAFREDAFPPWLAAATGGETAISGEWSKILIATDRWDEGFLDASRHLGPSQRLREVLRLQSLRESKGQMEAKEAALHPDQENLGLALSFLSKNDPEAFFALASNLIGAPEPVTDTRRWVRVSEAFVEAARRWNTGGRTLYQTLVELARRTGDKDDAAVLQAFPFYLAAQAVRGLLGSPEAATDVEKWTGELLQALDDAMLSKDDSAYACELFWCELIEHGPGRFLKSLIALLAHERKSIRSLAIEGLKHHPPATVVEAIRDPLLSGTTLQRLGAAELLASLGNAAADGLLAAALEIEKHDKVRAALHEAAKHISGGQPSNANDDPDFPALQESIVRQAVKLKLPATSWLQLEHLPPMFANDGTTVSPAVIGFVISKQSKQKTLEAAPDITPLLGHIDRGKSSSFGLALVDGFLNSEQAASDRWALALGGLLGDNRIIPPLLSRIPDWCENSRHKLAEYAAQAISLLPGNEPLMVLDTLANRYRSKFKNVGKACAAAFNAAAEARGITSDELGDMVVPDFGFDAEGIRRFEWDGGGASAELGADFKLSWFDPETDKAWKSLPASAPATVKEEVKTIGKLLREAMKGQTARLEMALVRQRRWPATRWRELHESHPLLRSFASGLVWGIYDGSGSLLRTFRRYPNGLLANASGDLEELREIDTSIGMVHPLELDAAAIEAWGAHLARFRVKQPFPQIARPVELPDPLHRNRREIVLTKDAKVGAGTFKSRGEKRGWVRGSVLDGGAISSIYKPFPGAGFEAILPTENYYMGIDPMESVELGAAYFVKADTVGRGGYTYDEPSPDDPRVLRFDQVPAVVWSETVADLKAIVGA